MASAERAAAIKEVYQPLHPHVYNLKVFCAKTRFWSAVMHQSCFLCPQESFLAPKFKQIVQYCQRKDATKDGLLALLEEAAGQKCFDVYCLLCCEPVGSCMS